MAEFDPYSRPHLVVVGWLLLYAYCNPNMKLQWLIYKLAIKFVNTMSLGKLISGWMLSMQCILIQYFEILICWNICTLSLYIASKECHLGVFLNFNWGFTFIFLSYKIKFQLYDLALLLPECLSSSLFTEHAKL